MRDDQHAAVKAGQERLEPGEAVEVEVVGRLVEQQDRRLGEQHAGQQRPRRLAAAEVAERRVERHVRDAEGVAGAVEPCLQRPASERVEALLRLAVSGQRSRLVQARLEPRQLAAQRPGLAERGAEQAVDREPGAGWLLREMADAVARPDATLPRSGAAAPASSASSVLLPAPLGPTSPARRPAGSVRDRPSKIVRSPWPARRSDALSKGTSGDEAGQVRTRHAAWACSKGNAVAGYFICVPR